MLQCFLSWSLLACLFKSTFRGGFAIVEARKVFMSSSASAVRKKDGSVLDFYCTKSLYGGTLASLWQIWIHCVSKRLDSESLTSQYGFATYADCSVSAGDALCLIQMELQNEEHKTRVADYPCLSKLNSIPHVDWKIRSKSDRKSTRWSFHQSRPDRLKS